MPTSKVSDWLDSQGLGKYADVFVENSITWILLSKLTADDLKELGLNIGERQADIAGPAALLGALLGLGEVAEARATGRWV